MSDEMSRSDCDQLSSVLASLRSGFLPPELQEHIARCEECADSAAVAASLQQLRLRDAGTRVMAGDHIWWKLQVRARTEAFEKVRRSVSVLQWTMCAAVILAAGFAAVWQWDAICAWSGFLAKEVSFSTAPARDFAQALWLSWKFSLLAGAGAIAIVTAVVAWLVSPQD